MESKTPKFDNLLDEIFEKLSPREIACKWEGKHAHCEGKFKLTEEDIKFLKLLRVPPPVFCPTCRRMRRLLHMNFTKLHKRKCDAPGHGEMMISIYPEECPFPVYDYKYFIGDEFDPFSFGKKYEHGKIGMDTLLSMRREFPVPSFLNRDPSSVNSDYSNGGRNTKNGYYVFACYRTENAWYSGLVEKGRYIMDSLTVDDSEFIYQSVQCDRMYKCSFAYFSSSCTESMFLFDCRNCDHCFGCVNLRGGKYMVFNKQLSEEEYNKFMKSISPFSRSSLKEYAKRFWDLVASLPMNASRNMADENCSGVNIRYSKNIYDSNNVMNNSENARHSDALLSHHDSMDVLFSGGHSSLLYMTCNIGSRSSRVKFSVSSKFCTDCEFVFNSKNLHDCFMCFGLQNKSYCVLNVQYSEEEYFKIVDEIKSSMLESGEYAEGLGFEFSAQAYNFSAAQISYPLSLEEIKELGGYFAQEPDTNAGGVKVLNPEEVPQTIGEVNDGIVNMAIKCEKTGRPFRIVPSELEFYRQTGLPLPTIHPQVRMLDNIEMIPYTKKYKAVCAKCGKDIFSMFDPARKFILYCEQCYQKEVY